MFYSTANLVFGAIEKLRIWKLNQVSLLMRFCIYMRLMSEQSIYSYLFYFSAAIFYLLSYLLKVRSFVSDLVFIQLLISNLWTISSLHLNIYLCISFHYWLLLLSILQFHFLSSVYLLQVKFKHFLVFFYNILFKLYVWIFCLKLVLLMLNSYLSSLIFISLLFAN